MATALIFPGQGSQAVGMGVALAAAFPAARRALEEIDDALSQRLSRLMAEGPQSELTLTENAQPALLAASLAATRALEAEAGKPAGALAAFVAGHSLGEYSALAAVGAFAPADAARLLRLRGQAMQRAVAPGDGAMAALIGAEIAAAEALIADAAEGEALDLANDNGGGQIVISGAAAAVARAVARAAAHGVRRAVPLDVSAPFHCRLMAPAAAEMADALGATPPGRPAVPVVQNVTAAPTDAPDEIRANLVAQVAGRVRWRECMAAMAAAGCGLFIELGAGKVLTGLAKRTAPDARALALGAPEDVDAVLAALAG